MDPVAYGEGNVYGNTIIQSFSKEQLQERAKEFMRLRFGPIADLSLADKRYYHEVTGILMFYVNHIWGDFGGG